MFTFLFSSYNIRGKMSATTDIVSIIRRKNDGKYFKVVTHPILITELNSANPNDLKGETRTMP